MEMTILGIQDFKLLTEENKNHGLSLTRWHQLVQRKDCQKYVKTSNPGKKDNMPS